MTIDGVYSRAGFHQMFDESKRYVGMRMQKGVPVVDADLNDLSDSLVTQLRRVIQTAIGDGSIAGNNGFKIAQAAAPSNNFKITGGDGTDEGSGQLFLAGLPCRLNSDVDYVSTSKLVHPQVAARTDTVLTDDAANYMVNELAGRNLCPDVDNPGTVIVVVSNTATTITVAAGLNAATSVGKHYRVNLTTPGSPRIDEVYVDAFLDEVSSVEDSNLIHSLGGGPTPTTAALRVVVRQIVKVREDGVAPTGTVVDALGRRHYYRKIATLVRTAAVANVTTAMISDTRPVAARRGDVVLLNTVSGIDGLATGTPDLYTAPPGKTALPLFLSIRATTAVAVTQGPRVGAGVAAGEDDVFAPQELVGLTDTTKARVFAASGLVALVAAGSTIKLGIDVVGVGTTLVLEASLYGREF